MQWGRRHFVLRIALLLPHTQRRRPLSSVPRQFPESSGSDHWHAGDRVKIEQGLVTGDEAFRAAVQRWLAEACVRQWDYKNIVRRKGVLEKLGAW